MNSQFTVKINNLLITLLVILSIQLHCNAQQCVTIPSTCGFTVKLEVTPVSIIPSSLNCTFGYNYNVNFNYTVTVTGVNTCFNGQVGLQPLLICGGQSNGYYTILVNAPTVGAASTTSVYTGNLTTSTNPFLSTSDCATATPASLGCNSMNIQYFGPGLSSPIACIITLPLNLLNFEIFNINNNQNKLIWKTTNEKDFSHFIIEKSDNTLEFNSLAIAMPSESNYYSYVDQNGAGKYYYRLKMVDNDGTYNYSKVISIDSKNASLYCETENPVKINEFIVKTNMKNGNISLTNYEGKLMPIKVLNLGDNVYKLIGNSIKRGIYFLSITSSNGSNIRKIIVE